MVILEKLYTADDLWEISHLPENEGKRMELIEGGIIEMPPAGWEHGDIAGVVLGLIWSYVRQHQLGRVTAAETGFSLTGDGLNVLAPDVGFIAAARAPEQLPRGFVPFAPDLAVEVASPGDSAADLFTKVEKYLQNGTRLVWVIFPERRKVAVYRPLAGKRVGVDSLGVADVLDGEDVLPGFALPVKECFAKKSE